MNIQHYPQDLTVIAGFFNEIVFFSLLGATVFTALVKGFFKVYYHYKL